MKKLFLIKVAFFLILSASVLAFPDKKMNAVKNGDYFTEKFDVNAIESTLSNYGHLVFHESNYAGMFWPKGSGKVIDYASALWLVGKKGIEIRTAVTEYQSEFVPGPIRADGEKYRIYKINRDGTGDWDVWPFDIGAPALKKKNGLDSL